MANATILDDIGLERASNRISALMRLRGFSGVKMAGKMGVSRQAFYRLLNEQTPLKLTHVERIAKILDVSMSDIVR